MLYRETGQFKTSYGADQAIFPIRQDRWVVAGLLAVAFLVVPWFLNDYWTNAVILPFLIYSLAAMGLNILTGYCGQLSLGTGAFLAVGAYARLVYSLHRLRGSTDIPLAEYLVSAYDDLTPMWRYYHTPIEVGGWFHEAGFTAPLLSHWDNPYGFGVVATRAQQDATPGIHYGDGVKLWDENRTLIG